MDDETRALLGLLKAYCAATGRGEARVATLCASDGKFFKRIERGGGLLTSTFRRIIQWFSDRWPEHAEWPPSISRPPAGDPALSTPRQRRRPEQPPVRAEEFVA